MSEPPPAGPVASALPVARGALLGGVTGALVVVARGAGLLEGWAGVVVVAAGLLALPTSRELSRRILLAGCLVLGWLPVAWWVPWPWPGVGHVTVGLAILLGAQVAWVFAGDPRRRAALLLPRVRTVDAIPGLAVVATAAVVSPWLRVSSGDGALAMLFKGWDHSAHYDMVRMIREHGAVIGQAGTAPLGDSWSYADYPQGFHTIAAAVLELVSGPQPLAVGDEVLAYAHVLGWLTVVGAVVVAAGLCAVPFLRRRPWAALPAVVVAVGGLVLGPGGFMLKDGFPNFALAVVLLACVPLIALPLDRVVNPVHVAALGGALVGIAHGWLLLLTLAVPLTLVALLPLRRRRFAASRARWLLVAAVVAATCAGVLVAVLMVAGQPVADVLTISGGITAPPVVFLFAPAALAIAVCLVTAWRPPWAGPRRRSDVRVVATAVVPLLGLVGSGAIAGLQLRSGAQLSYYFWKYAIGMAVLSIVLVAIAVARLVPPRVHAGDRRVWVASAVATVVLSQGYGVTVVVPDAFWTSPALEVSAKAAASATNPTVLATYLQEAAAADLAPGSRHVLITSWAETDVHPVTAGQWYNAVTGRWTDQANEALLMLFGPMDTAADRATVAVQVLTADPDAVVLVPPADHPGVLELVPTELQDRVLTW